MSVCPVCQTSNAAGIEYCARCGSRLADGPVSLETTTENETAASLNEQAIRAVARDEMPDALELVTRALELDQGYVPAIRTRADILRRIGLTTQAAAEEAKIRTLEGSERVYAGFWSRALALFLDSIFSFLITLIPGIIVAAIIYAIVVPDNPSNAEQDDAYQTAAYGWYAVGGFVGFVYYWIGNSRGATWGKHIAKIRVVSIDNGASIGYGRGLVRHIVSYIGALAIYVGWLWMLWDKDKQTWHDKAAGSVVVKAPRDS
jgi:uncharacterized RDD family membrane protein YckC